MSKINMNTFNQGPTNLVYIHGGQPVTDTKIIADAVGMRHADVVRALKNREFFSQRNIASRDFVDDRGKRRTAYLLDERHTYLFVMRLTTKKAEEWQEKFVDAFIALRDQAISYQLPYQPELIEELKAENRDLREAKARITRGREGTLFSMVGRLSQKVKKLEQTSDIDRGYKKATVWRSLHPDSPLPTNDSQLGKELSKHSREQNFPILKVDTLIHGKVITINLYSKECFDSYLATKKEI